MFPSSVCGRLGDRIGAFAALRGGTYLAGHRPLVRRGEQLPEDLADLVTPVEPLADVVLGWSLAVGRGV